MTSQRDDEFQDPLEDYDPPKYKDPLEEALAEKSVTEIQASPHTVIPADMSVQDAMRKLAGQDIACVMVEEDGRLAGVFSDRDVLDRVALEFDSVKHQPISSVMTTEPVCVYETDSAAAALSVMAVTGYRHVPVVSLDENILGIISPQRLTKFLHKYAQA